MSEAGRLLKNVSLFSQLSDATLAGLATHLRRHTYRKDTMLFHKDQAGDALYIVESGHVKIFLPTPTGEELTVDIAGTGEVFGELALLDGGPRSASAQAQEDTVLFTLSRNDFLAYLNQTPQLGTALVELLSRRLRHVTDYAESLAFLDVYTRVVRTLLQMADRYGRPHNGGVEIDLTVTQTDLASMVGATRERVNRALAALRAQNLVDLRGKKLFLLAPDKLRQRLG